MARVCFSNCFGQEKVSSNRWAHLANVLELMLGCRRSSMSRALVAQQESGITDRQQLFNESINVSNFADGIGSGRHATYER